MWHQMQPIAYLPICGGTWQQLEFIFQVLAKSSCTLETKKPPLEAAVYTALGLRHDTAAPSLQEIQNHPKSTGNTPSILQGMAILSWGKRDKCWAPQCLPGLTLPFPCPCPHPGCPGPGSSALPGPQGCSSRVSGARGSLGAGQVVGYWAFSLGRA